MTPRSRAVFLGSGEFALPVLESLAGRSDVEVVAVVSTPPQPAGRSHRERATPVARRAGALGLALLTPLRLGEPAAQAALAQLAPELIVLADYGRLVPRAILALPRLGSLNLHPSLLPRHRGASPIQAALLAGDVETGVSLMSMDEGLDTGPLVAQVRTAILPGDTTPRLEARLALLAAALLEETLGAWIGRALAAVPQAEEGATFTRPLRRADGRLDPTRRAVELERQVRALQPWPGTFVETAVGRIVFWRVDIEPASPSASGPPAGTFLADADGLLLQVGDGRLRLLEVQPAGGRRMSGAELHRGRPGLVGSRIAELPVG
ncbi:MAG: methionyl-tRNA formyltransferase [Candidatus Limnocylindrales bacterium]